MLSEVSSVGKELYEGFGGNLVDGLPPAPVPARIFERRAFASGPTRELPGFFSETLLLKELSGNI